MDSNGRMKEFERKIKCKKFMFCYVKVFYVIVAYMLTYRKSEFLNK